MSFQQALSGLATANAQLGTIGNNIANGSTVGFKGATAQFSDAFAVAMMGGGTSQIGIGAQVVGTRQQFVQGNLSTTSNPLDVAINGGGLFRLDNNGTITFSRNGQFLLNKEGYLINDQGLKVTGYAADPVTGGIVPGNLVPLQVDNTAIPPLATSKSQVQVNLDSRAKEPLSMLHGSITASKQLNGLQVVNGTDPHSTATPPPPSPPGAAYRNNSFDINVDGSGWLTVVLAAGNYDTPGQLAAEMERAINVALDSSGRKGVSVDVNVNNENKIQITSNSVGSLGSIGKGSLVDLRPVTDTGGTVISTGGFYDFFGSAPSSSLGPYGYTMGDVNVVAAPPGGGTWPVASLGAKTFDISVNGEAQVTVGVPAGSYTDAFSYAKAVRTAINEALGNANQMSKVDVELDVATGAMKIIAKPSTVSRPDQTLSVVLGGAGDVAQLFGDPSETNPANPGYITRADGRDMDRFDLNSVNTYTASTAQTVYDSLGNPHTMSLYYVKTSQPKVWQMYTTLDGDPTAVNGPTTLMFDASGKLDTPAPGTKLKMNFELATGAESPFLYELDLTGTTQYGVAFGTNQLIQDGYTSGRLSGLSISADGTVQGRYSNGKSRNMGQIVLANFNNLNGLQSLGNNQWAETAESGSPIPGSPGTANLGVLSSGQVEESTVDMTQELVNMITAQRAYQANAQSIKTQDQIMQTLVNLR